MAAREGIARMVSRIVPPKEIEDIVQETYVKICQLDGSDTIAQPKSFMYRTARNLAIDHLKRAETRLADAVEDEQCYVSGSHGADVDELFEQAASNEEFGHFCEAVRLLPVQCRKVFVLKKVYGYSQAEIARDLNISASTVEKHIALGIRRCTTYMLQISNPDKGSANNNVNALLERR